MYFKKLQLPYKKSFKYVLDKSVTMSVPVTYFAD